MESRILIFWFHNSWFLIYNLITNPRNPSFSEIFYTIYCSKYQFTRIVDNYTCFFTKSSKIGIFGQKSCIVPYNSWIWIFEYLQRLSKYSRKCYFRHFWSILEISDKNLINPWFRWIIIYRNDSSNHTFFDTSLSPIRSIRPHHLYARSSASLTRSFVCILTRYVLYHSYVHLDLINRCNE